MPSINLWLDDERPAPEGWKHAFDFDHAVHLVLYYKEEGFTIENMSLDHDLGEEKTGYDFVKWLAEFEHWPTNKPTVHSMNPVGAANMRSVINRYGPY